MIHAAEDVGIADPMALVVAVAASQAVERVGLPEARIIMAESALYVALAPKSNSVVAGIGAGGGRGGRVGAGSPEGFQLFQVGKAFGQ